MSSQDRAGDWFDAVKVEYATLFPELPHRTRYYRVLKKLERIFADFALRFAGADSLHVIDAKPLPIVLDKTAGSARASTGPVRCRDHEGSPEHMKFCPKGTWFEAYVYRNGVLDAYGCLQLQKAQAPRLCVH